MLTHKARPVFEIQQTPGIVSDETAVAALQAGINQVVDALSPTLGPFPRLVAVERAIRSKGPELLDSGGEIARRIIQLPDKTEDVGAMLVRGMIWKLHEQVGDGTVTAALIFQSLFNQGVRYISAGSNAALLRESLNTIARHLLDKLDSMARPLCKQSEIISVAHSICADAEIAQQLGEIFHVIGEHGRLEIRMGQRGESWHEFIEGSFWEGGQHGSSLTSPRIEEADAAILVTDLSLDDPQDLLPLLRSCGEAEVKTLFLVCTQVSDRVLALCQKSQQSDRLRIFPIRINGHYPGLPHAILQDVAVLTGGETLLTAAGYHWASVRPEYFGQARRIWVDRDYFGLVNGKGDPRLLRHRLYELRRQYESTDDLQVREAALQRFATLNGGTATLHIGGETEAAVAQKRALAKRAANTVRAALQSGVVPGGGVSLVRLTQVLGEIATLSQTREYVQSLRMFQAALQAPFRALLTNCGIEVGDAVQVIQHSPYPCVYDVRVGAWVDADTSQIFDVANVLKHALRFAAQHAALALTVDTVVHRHKPPLMATPDGRSVMS
jgi:chaperonin GroEL